MISTEKKVRRKSDEQFINLILLRNVMISNQESLKVGYISNDVPFMGNWEVYENDSTVCRCLAESGTDISYPLWDPSQSQARRTEKQKP
jgi:hypothetical protein